MSKFDAGPNASNFAAYYASQLDVETENMVEEEKTLHLVSFPMPVPTTSIRGNEERFADSINTYRPFFVTSSGFVGRCYDSVQAGDTLCIFFSAITPYILRPRPDHYRFFGDCFVSGLMSGEVIHERRIERWFELR
jgi:hypothetical protein